VDIGVGSEMCIAPLVANASRSFFIPLTFFSSFFLVFSPRANDSQFPHVSSSTEAFKSWSSMTSWGESLEERDFETFFISRLSWWGVGGLTFIRDRGEGGEEQGGRGRLEQHAGSGGGEGARVEGRLLRRVYEGPGKKLGAPTFLKFLEAHLPSFKSQASLL